MKLEMHVTTVRISQTRIRQIKMKMELEMLAITADLFPTKTRPTVMVMVLEMPVKVELNMAIQMITAMTLVMNTKILKMKMKRVFLLGSWKSYWNYITASDKDSVNMKEQS